MIYRIAETTSTNDDAKRPEYRHGDIVWAERQTAGRGQRGHSWTSPEGENLTFTLVLEPVFLPVGEQFLLSEAVTLALTDTFAAFGIDIWNILFFLLLSGTETVAVILIVVHMPHSFLRIFFIR